jgi:hypothetical protein
MGFQPWLPLRETAKLTEDLALRESLQLNIIFVRAME